ncbi:unnamed protein product, partial [Protopolystoma xenopodis]
MNNILPQYSEHCLQPGRSSVHSVQSLGPTEACCTTLNPWGSGSRCLGVVAVLTIGQTGQTGAGSSSPPSGSELDPDAEWQGLDSSFSKIPLPRYKSPE